MLRSAPALVGVVVALALAGCDRPCDVDGDCPAAERCDDDTKVCVVGARDEGEEGEGEEGEGEEGEGEEGEGEEGEGEEGEGEEGEGEEGEGEGEGDVGTVVLVIVDGDGQTAPAASPLAAPLVVEARDARGGVVAGVNVSVVGDDGGSAGPAVDTGDDGRAAFVLRVGHAAGIYHFTASARGASAGATASATPLDAGDGFVLAGVSGGQRQDGDAPVPSSAADLVFGGISGVAASADGGLFVADPFHRRIYRVDARGALSVVFDGFGTGSFIGALALDEARSRLYFCDQQRVRLVDLTTGGVRNFAGNGEAGTGGDGGAATSAQLNGCSALAVAPNGTVAIGFPGSSQVRAVSPQNIMLTLHAADALCPSVNPDALVFDDAGVLFAAGSGCGVGGVGSAVVGRYDGAAFVALSAGSAGVPVAGARIDETSFGAIGGLALDAGGNLYVSDGADSDSVVRVDGTTGLVSVVVEGVDDPRAVAVASDGSLVFVDNDGLVVRGVVGVASDVATAIDIAPAGDVAQSIVVTGLSAPLGVRLVGADAAPLAGLPVLFVENRRADRLVSPVARTDGDGAALAGFRPGLALGAASLTARYFDLHGAVRATLDVGANVVEPVVGTLLTVVNVARAAPAFDGPPADGPATAAPICSPRGLVDSGDGRVFFVTTCAPAVFALEPDGFLTRIAGTTESGGAANNVAALQARFANPSGLALDAARQRLYISDSGNDRIRFLDLVDGRVKAFAGGGSAQAEPFGDGGAAASATLSAPGDLVVTGDGTVVFSDQNHGRFRAVNPVTNVIVAVPPPADSFFQGPGDLAVDLRGNVYGVAASEVSSNEIIVRLGGPDGAVIVAGDGTSAGVNQPGADASESRFSGITALSVDVDGALLITTSERILRAGRPLAVGGPFGLVTSVLEASVDAPSGDFLPASQGTTSSPQDALAANGHLYVAEQNNAVRVIW